VCQGWVYDVQSRKNREKVGASNCKTACGQCGQDNFEGLVLHGLPFVKAGLAQGDAAGFCLAAGAAGGLEVDDVSHSGFNRVRPY
jgi:hypothetical protein